MEMSKTASGTTACRIDYVIFDLWRRVRSHSQQKQTREAM